MQNVKIPPHTRSLGSPLLAYILNLDEAAAQTLVSDGGQVTPPQKQAVELCEQMLLQLKSSMIKFKGLEFEDIQALKIQRSESGRYVLNELRKLSGGNLTLETTHDPLKHALAELCLECYPFTLLPERYCDLGSSGLPKFPIQEEKMARFIAAVRSDDALMKLFPDGADDDCAMSRRYYSSFGRGGQVQLPLLHERIIQAAIAMMHARNESSASALQYTAWEMLSILRSALSEKKPASLVIDIFDMVGLPNNFEVSLGDSTLKGIPKPFMRYIPAGARPGQNRDGDPLGCMLQRNCEFDIALADFDAPSLPKWPVEDCRNNGVELQRVVSLATSLVIETESATAARLIATVTIDPIDGVVHARSDRTSPSLGPHHLASLDECKRLEGKVEIIQSKDAGSIEMAIKRYLSAIAGRNDEQDSLVDAVIGLENLFGGRAEIAFSVACGVANLLGKDAAERDELFRQYKKVYDARSKLVHGNSMRVPEQKISDLRNSAVDFLRRSLQELFENRDDLLPLRADERIKKLVIG